MDDSSSRDREGQGIYLTDVLGMLRRRWLVVLVALLLIGGGVGVTYLKAPTSYQATGQLLLLLPPQASGSDAPTNPYLNLHPGLDTAAALIASTMNTPESQRSVAAGGHTAQYDIALSPDSGPLLVITTEAADPQQAIATRDEVINRLQVELARIQAEENAPKRQLIHTRTNGTFNEAEVLTGDRTRAVAAVGAAGLLLTLMVVVAWDRIAIRRRAARAAAAEAAAEARPEPLETVEDEPALAELVESSEPEPEPRRLEPVATSGLQPSAQETVDEPEPELDEAEESRDERESLESTAAGRRS